ncbi:MAG: queuosine salvage family protein [Thermodesulfobacteriota bacterium]
MQEVVVSCRKVMEEARHVAINREALGRLAKDLAGADARPLPYRNGIHFQGSPEKTLWYVLVLTTVNFCFFPEPGRKRWEKEGSRGVLSGYDGMAAALTYAFEAGMPLDDPRYLASMPLSDFMDMIGPRGSLPLVEQRVSALNELGRVLGESFSGSPERLVEAAQGSAVRLCRLAARALTSFRDFTLCRGRAVFFYKRAQILGSDLAGAFSGQGPGAFRDLDKLTCFADYKLPQVLREAGVLAYAPELTEQVDTQRPLSPGAEEEAEIRAATVAAVEGLKQALAEQGVVRSSRDLDNILWTLGQDDRYRRKPYHRVYGIYY